MQQSDVQQVADQAWGLAQAQRFGEANAQFARLCEISPNDPEAWMMRGATQLELGDASLAANHLNRALELDPAYADPCLHLGKLALNAGKLDEARRWADQAVQLDPGYLEAWVLRGAVCALRGEFDAAEHSAHQALALNPRELSALTTLVHALRGQAKYAAAADAGRQFLALNPQSAEAGLLLADSLVRLGKPDEARGSYQQFLAIHPGSVEAWLGLGQIDLEQKNLEAALASYRKVIALQPGNAQAHNYVGNALLAMKDVRGAEAAFRKALSVDPHLAEAQANLGVLLQGEGKFGGARKYYEAALKQLPGNAMLHSRLASMLETLGDFQGAIEHCDQAAVIDPGNLEYRVKKARVLQKKGEHRQSCELLRPDVEQGSASVNAVVAFAQSLSRLGNETAAVAWLEGALARTGLSNFERQRVHSALGMIHDKANRFDEAFGHFAQANRLKGGQFDIKGHARYVESLRHTFTRQFLADAPRGDSSTEQPVFIVGMPRSGTSLIEQILASHPAVHGVGELEDIGRLASELQDGSSKPGGLVNPAKLTQEKLAAMAADYLGVLREQHADAERITEKMPHNFLHLGLIELLFPKARIIHVVRDSLDTCVSCFFQEFNEAHAYTHDLELLGKYYTLYEGLMQHWERTLTLPMLKVRYESLVENQEAESRRLVEFCGLEWDDQVLRFYETRRNVATPSFEQVRQPMYKKSVARWKNYEAHLAPLVTALK